MAKEKLPKISKQELRDAVNSLTTERDELQDQLIRARAEIANTSKRLTQYYEARMKTAGFSIAKDLLSSIDSIQTVIKTIQDKENPQDDVIGQGILLIGEELETLLYNHNITPIESLNEPFDPTLHEAMLQDYESNKQEGIITQEFQKGYRIADHILRHSRVAVAAKKEEVSNEEKAGDENSESYNNTLETNK